MTIINDTTVVVFTYAELKTVLEGTNNYSYIYFGANITLTAGIKIASTKTNITIDGTYQNVRYTYEDMKNLSASNTIYVSSSNTTKVTVQNMDITGYNYYGVIYVPESNTYANTVIEYNNVTYEGPQMIYHPNGLTRIISSNITIKDVKQLLATKWLNVTKSKLVEQPQSITYQKATHHFGSETRVLALQF